MRASRSAREKVMVDAFEAEPVVVVVGGATLGGGATVVLDVVEACWRAKRRGWVLGKLLLLLLSNKILRYMLVSIH
jgi:hypothetical protein